MSSHRRSAAFILGLVAIALVPLPVIGQAPTPPTPYRPGLGDLMTMAVQPRHLKVGLAGQQKNWAYAAYEVHELEEALERVVKLSPKWRNIDIAALMRSSTREPMEALEQAAKAKDSKRFDEAYGRLTSACNACHKSANVGFIVIRAPDSSPFANQDFRPAAP